MAREYIESEDLLNTGRKKLNRSIDKSYDAEETSAQALKDANELGNQAIDDANKLGNEAKQISTEKGNESIFIANKKGDESIAIARENEKVADEANLIAKDTNDRMNQIISSETDSAEIIDARKPLDEESYPTLNERLNNQIGKTTLFRQFEKPLVEKMMNSFFEREVNIKDFGAKCDGVTVDDEAINEAVNVLKSMGGGTLFFPEGVTIVDFVIKIEGFPIKIKGVSRFLSTVKAKNQSKLFHNTTRDLTSNKNVDLNKLYRDYHAIFFFRNCHVVFENIDIFGNPENNFESINDEKFYFYGESIHSHLGVKGYKYFHGVVTLYDDGAKRIFKANDCSFRQFSWNDVLINNNGIQTDVEIDVKNCFFDGSAQDGISVHKVKGQSDIRNNVFRNCNTHATHVYFDAWDVNVDFNHYIYDDENYFNFYPNVKNGVRKHCIQIGHGSYVNNLLKNIKIRGNTVKRLSENLSYEVCALFLGKTIDGLVVSDNNFENVDYTIMSYPLILGDCVIENNKSDFKVAGVLFNLDSLIDGELHPNYSKPYRAKIILKNNKIVSKISPKNSLRAIVPNSLTNAVLEKFVIECEDNQFSGMTTTQNKMVEVLDNNYFNRNLMKISYDLVADKANGFRGRNSTNQYTNYQMTSPTVVDLNGQNVIVNGFIINSTGNPNVNFDNVTYYEELKIDSGKFALKMFLKSDEDITVRGEIRRQNGELIKTIFSDTVVKVSSAYNLYTFQFEIEQGLSINNQILQLVFNANGTSKKLINLCVAGFKLEKMKSDFIFPTKNNSEDENTPVLSYSINSVPLRAGLTTIVGRNVYMSVGNLSPSDWVKLTNN